MPVRSNPIIVTVNRSISHYSLSFFLFAACRGPHSGEGEEKAPAPEEFRRLDPSQLDILRSALFSMEEPLRISSLEVADLRVDRLTVSQLEAYKIAASEIDAIVVSATEMSNKSGPEGGIHPSLIQELISIRNQLGKQLPQCVMSRAEREARKNLIITRIIANFRLRRSGNGGPVVIPSAVLHGERVHVYEQREDRRPGGAGSRAREEALHQGELAPADGPAD
jgi:hypothetical protein